MANGYYDRIRVISPPSEAGDWEVMVRIPTSTDERGRVSFVSLFGGRRRSIAVPATEISGTQRPTVTQLLDWFQRATNTYRGVTQARTTVASPLIVTAGPGPQ